MEKRGYTRVRELLPEINRLVTKGKSQKEIAERLGLRNKEVVKELLKRERKREADKATGLPAKQRARKAAVTLQEYKYECKRLAIENELLRDFLYLAGRR